MKHYLSNIKNIGVVTLLTLGLIILSCVVIFVFYMSIDLIFYNNGNEPKYNWSIILSMIFSISMITLIFYKQTVKHRTSNNIDDLITWNIAYIVVLIISLYYLGSASYYGVKKFTNRDKNPKITSLSELLENSDELAGKTISLSNEMFDSTLLANDVNATVDNVNLKWKEVISEEGNFSILFPNFEVKKEIKRQLIEGQELPVYTIMLNTKDKIDVNLGYSVSYFSLKNVESVEKLFKNQRNSILSKVNGTLENEYIIDSLGYQCHELYITVDNNDIKATTRMIYNQDKFYTISVLTEHGNLFNKGIYHFINSFKFQK